MDFILRYATSLWLMSPAPPFCTHPQTVAQCSSNMLSLVTVMAYFALCSTAKVSSLKWEKCKIVINFRPSFPACFFHIHWIILDSSFSSRSFARYSSLSLSITLSLQLLLPFPSISIYENTPAAVCGLLSC